MENYLGTNNEVPNEYINSGEHLPQTKNNILNEIKVISTRFCIASKFDIIDFVNCIYDMIESSQGNYYNPVSFRYNMDPTFWMELIDSYSS